MTQRFAIYYRVSTNKQGENGLGMQAQEATVKSYLSGKTFEIVGIYKEVVSGGKDDRQELKKAIRDCELKNARLLVAKLDRLSRDLYFITHLQRTGVKFTIAEMPDANELTVHIYTAMAQHERQIIGQRTKAALAHLKGTGKLGNPCLREGRQIENSGNTVAARAARRDKTMAYAKKLLPIVEEIRTQGATSLREIATALNKVGYKTYAGRAWNHGSVARLLKNGS